MTRDSMIFDRMLSALAEIFNQHHDAQKTVGSILINRDLNGRIRLIVDEKCAEDTQAKNVLDTIAREIEMKLGPHAYPAGRAVLFEPNVEYMLERETTFPLESCEQIHVVDRLATEGNWAAIAPDLMSVPRIVFYSIKGGVGRSTALAAVAWALAEQGKRVLVLDLDLESPGLSSSLLSEDRRPAYGIVDWLVEDLVANGDVVFDDLVAISDLSRMGEILVAPAHGVEPGEYVSKLGRVWMPKVENDGSNEPWPARLSRLVQALERRWLPDVVLIDSRAGIDEVASAIITDLGVSLILLFAIDGDHTWNGYRILFEHWRKTGAVRDIRERLQVVAAMIPELGAAEYFQSLRENAWNIFLDEIYDELPAQIEEKPEPDEEIISWNFDLADETAPHYPWVVRWNRGFAALRSLHVATNWADVGVVASVFGSLIEGIAARVTPWEEK